MNEEERFETTEEAPTELPEVSVTEEESTEDFPATPVKESSVGNTIVTSVFEVTEIFIYAVFAVLLIFSFAFRLCRVDGSSMENTLHDSELILLSDIAYTPAQDDVVVFHLTNKDANMEKTLIKRVIATSGQKVVINFSTKEITVDGEVYADSHAVLKNLSGREIDKYLLTAEHAYDPVTNVFSATVPEGCLFLMGDNRNNSKDSRDTDIGFVDARCVLGKVVLRFTPFTVFS